MSAPGQPKALDPDKQKTICSLVGEGISLRQVARLVACDPKTIRREAQRNDEFRQQLDRARSEANIHPLQTLRQAAKTNWRAALEWMERLDPQRFAKHNPNAITQREANQFAVDLADSIDRAVSDTLERQHLFELLTAAMPTAMRRQWDGKERRRTLAATIENINAQKSEVQELRAARRRELMALIGSYIPLELNRVLAQYSDVLNLPEEAYADNDNDNDNDNESTTEPQAPHSLSPVPCPLMPDA